MRSRCDVNRISAAFSNRIRNRVLVAIPVAAPEPALGREDAEAARVETRAATTGEAAPRRCGRAGRPQVVTVARARSMLSGACGCLTHGRCGHSTTPQEKQM